MKKQYLFCLSVLLVLMMACSFGNFEVPLNSLKGSGNLVREEKPVNGITRVDFSGLGNMTVKQGDQELLVIEADDNIMPHLTTKVVGDRLEIGMEKGTSISGPVTLNYTLTVKDLTDLEISGLGDIHMDGLSTAELAIGISGGGNLDLTGLDVERLTVNLSGLGNVSVEGNAGEQKLDISGGGSYKAGSLKSETTEVTISGLGGATVWASEQLDVTISGGGDVDYYGNPQVSQNVSGLGKISHREDK